MVYDDSREELFLPCAPNSTFERYIWSPVEKVALSVQALRDMSDSGADVSHFNTVLDFPPGSYMQAYEGNYIHNPSSQTHEFVKAQQCVPQCRFSTKNKRPVVIREHIAKCQHRMQQIPQPDALARLFCLELGAMRNPHGMQ